MKTGVFLARMQPLHNAHMFMVNEALKDCDRVFVVLGSANKKDMIRNPFSLELREKLLREALSNVDDKLVTIFELPDWSTENDQLQADVWGEYLYYNLVSRAKQKKFTFYYGDSPDIMLSWFKRDHIIHNVSFKFYDRQTSLEGLSATKIREALLNNNIAYLEKYCPPSVVKSAGLLRGIWEDVLATPVDDFSME